MATRAKISQEGDKPDSTTKKASLGRKWDGPKGKDDRGWETDGEGQFLTNKRMKPEKKIETPIVAGTWEKVCGKARLGEHKL